MNNSKKEGTMDQTTVEGPNNNHNHVHLLCLVVGLATATQALLVLKGDLIKAFESFGLDLNPDPNTHVAQYLRKDKLEKVCTDNGGEVMSTAALGKPRVEKQNSARSVVYLQFDKPTLADRISSVAESSVNGFRVFFGEKPIDLFKQGGNPTGTTYGNGCKLTNPSPAQIIDVLNAINRKTM